MGCVFLSAESEISLTKLLNFFTGANEIPVGGFRIVPTLGFSANNPYPVSSTCSMELILPTIYTDYTKFKESMNTAITFHRGFGKS